MAPKIVIDADVIVEKGIVEIRVADNGIGFDQKYADKIFTIFERLHGRSKYEGTGIGLAVVKKIVSRHHGDIFVKSKEGEGTTFFIRLKLAE